MIISSGLVCNWCGKYILPVLHDDYKTFETDNGEIYHFHNNCADEFIKEGEKRKGEKNEKS